PDRTGPDRLRSPVITRFHHPAHALARSPLQYAGLVHRYPFEPLWRHGRLPYPLECLYGLQTAHRQGRNGIRRLQAAGNARGVDGLAGIARHHHYLVTVGFGDRHLTDSLWRSRSQPTDTVWPLSRYRWLDSPALRSS